MVAALATGGASSGRPAQSGQRPVFHASTAAVAVDVSVKRGNVPVVDLTSGDFVLTDNGVRQQVEAVTVEAIPIDVSLVVDVSGSTARNLLRYRSDVIEIARLLRPMDRIRLVSLDTLVVQVFPLQPAGERPPVESLSTGRFSSVYDGIASVLLRQPDLDRRSLIVGFTDGFENRSILTSSQLLSAAERAESVLHVVGLSGGVPPEGVYPQTLTSNHLRDVAEATGGAAHGGSLLSGSIVGDFKKIFDDFRKSYVLRFTPAGVPRTGWHDLSVTVTRAGNLTVHARKGYFGG